MRFNSLFIPECVVSASSLWRVIDQQVSIFGSSLHTDKCLDGTPTYVVVARGFAAQQLLTLVIPICADWCDCSVSGSLPGESCSGEGTSCTWGRS